jgi:predicted dehydrogenase
MPLQESPSADRRSAPRVAFAGPCSPVDRALVQEAGGEVVSDIASANVVHVTLDPQAAADAAETLIANGHHVVLHTLADLTSNAATALASRAAEAGLTVTVPFVHRYYPMIRMARRRVLSGSPGALYLLHGWALSESVPAWFDLIEFVTSHRVDRIVAAPVSTSRAEATATVAGSMGVGVGGLLFTTDHGSVGTLAVSHSRPVDGGTLLVALDGTEEKIAFHEGRPEVLDVIGSQSTERFQRAIGADVSRYSTSPAGRPQGHRDCWAAYLGDAYTATSGQQPDGLPTLADLARTSALAGAVRESEQSAAWSPVALDATPHLVTTSHQVTEGTPS